MNKRRFVTFAGMLLCTLLYIVTVQAQNTSPYWSLAGNSNATTSSKLGTTNAIPLRMLTKNTERMRIDTLGRIGIGTAAPLQKLHVAGTGVFTSNLGVGTTAPTSRLQVNAATGSSPLKFLINSVTKLYMSSGGGLSVGSGTTAPANGLYVAGNVGIGTTVPTSRLTVSSALGVSPFQVLVGGVPQLFVSNVGGLSVGTNTAAPEKGLSVEGTVIIGKSSETDLDYASALTVANGGIVVHNSSTSIGIEGFGDLNAGIGVAGRGFTGVLGRSLDGTGVYADGAAIGLEARATNTDGIAVKTTSSYIGIHAFGPYVGVYGVSDNYAGYFEGDVYTTGTYQPSARQLKQNISALSNAMALITKLQPKEYEYKQDGAFKLMHLPLGKRYGLIAEEVEQVLPGLVKASEFDPHMAQPTDSDTNQLKHSSEKIAFKALNYIELIPIMIRGMQEQETADKAKDAKIANLEAEVAELRQMVLELKGGTGTVTAADASLEQNTPNPAGGTTIIRYHIPEITSVARLELTNTKGQLFKSISIRSSGTGQVTLNTAMLAAGTYNYTLYVDGKQVDTKRLVIAW